MAAVVAEDENFTVLLSYIATASLQLVHGPHLRQSILSGVFAVFNEGDGVAKPEQLLMF